MDYSRVMELIYNNVLEPLVNNRPLPLLEGHSTTTKPLDVMTAFQKAHEKGLPRITEHGDISDAAPSGEKEEAVEELQRKDVVMQNPDDVMNDGVARQVDMRYWLVLNTD